MANAAYFDMDQHRISRMRKQFYSFETDLERMNWLTDMNYLEGRPGEYINSEQGKFITELLNEFFNPRTPDGGPDHEAFAERMDAYHQMRLQNRVACGQSALQEMREGMFSGSPEKSFIHAMQAPVGSKNMALDGLYIALNIQDEFKQPYADRIGIKQANLTGADEKLQNQLFNERFETAFKQSYTVKEGNFLNGSNEADKKALQYYYDMQKKIAKTEVSKLFTKEEDERQNEVLDGKHQQEMDRIRNEEMDAPMADVETALAQFNTKRSRIFGGRESKEHEDLRHAAEDYQSRLQDYLNADKKSPEDKRKALDELEKASRKMGEMADIYENKKGTVNTPAGLARLTGAQNLQQIATEMQQKIANERSAMDRAEQAEKDKAAKAAEEKQKAEQAKQKAAEAAKAKEDRINGEKEQWREAAKEAGKDGRKFGENANYQKLYLEMQQAWKSEGSIQTGSNVDKQLRSAIGALDCFEVQGLQYGSTNYGNNSIVEVKDIREATAQVIAIQSLYAKDPGQKYIPAIRISWEMKEIQARPGFDKMMENYEKEPGSLTDLARHDPSQLWQEMLRTERSAITGKSTDRTPMKLEGEESYFKQTRQEIAAMKPGQSAAQQAQTKEQTKEAPKRQAVHVDQIEKKAKSLQEHLNDAKAKEQKTVKTAQKHASKTVQKEDEGLAMGGEE